MDPIAARADQQEALDLLRRALAIFDASDDHVVAAQLDYVIHLVQGRSESERGR